MIAVAAAHRRKIGGGAKGKKFTQTDREHAVYPWIATAPGMELREISCEDVAEKYGMPERVFREYLQLELKGEQEVRSLPWAIVSVMLYALVLLYHESVHLNNAVEGAIDFDITENANFAFVDHMGFKNYEHVNNFADFWSWMGKGFVPLTLQWQHPASEGSGLDIGNLSARDRRQYLWHNLMLAPVKLSQELAEDVRCANRHVAGRYSMSCTGSSDINMDMSPSESQLLEAAYRENTQNTVWLYNSTDAMRIMTELEASRWLSKKVSRIKVSMIMYNTDSNLLVSTHINFLFARSGRIWKKIEHASMNLDPYADPWTYVWDICFYVQVTCVFVHESFELAGAFCRSRGSIKARLKSLGEYCRAWNAVDWGFVIASYVALGLWVLRVERLQDIQQSLLAKPPEDCSSGACNAHYARLYTQVADAGKFVAHLRIFGAILPLMIMLRMFKAFSAQPRLALVTETLRKAWTSLSHYLIVFVAIFGSYAAMGVAFFGRQVQAFATLDRSIATLFLMMLGAFDFAEMEAVGRGFAFFFFFSFMFLIVLIMLSMLIAIIMDVYVEVKAISKSSESVLLQTTNMARRAYQNWRKTRLSLNHIVPVLCVDDAKLLRVEHLLDPSSKYYVQGLARPQAKRLMTEAAKMWAFKHSPAVKPEDIKKFTDDVFKLLTPLVRFSATAAHTSLSLQDMVAEVQGREATTLDDALETDDGRTISREVPSVSAEQLALEVPAELLLKAAELKISLGHRLPTWPGSQNLLLQVVSTAQAVSSDFLHRAAI
mmetsp:Transcript_89272/g.257471  ORF Transcript_89272/g.257471 Transcript_89272/m.257471 type:complete len:773 (-) Transcript_89272:147-2465(-)